MTPSEIERATDLAAQGRASEIDTAEMLRIARQAMDLADLSVLGGYGVESNGVKSFVIRTPKVALACGG